MKVKTTKLIGPALDWAVAKCEGKRITLFCGVMVRNGPTLSPTHDDPVVKWNPSTDWSQGGPIVERENLVVGPTGGGIFPDKWAASSEDSPYLFGPTPLIAAMRCHVTNKLGDDVDVPEELL